MMSHRLLVSTLQRCRSTDLSASVVLVVICLILSTGVNLWAQGPLPAPPPTAPSPTPINDVFPPTQVPGDSGEQKKEESYDHYHRAEIEITNRRLVSGEHTTYVVAMRLEPDGTVTILEEYGGHSTPDAGGGDETERTVDEQYTWSVQGGKVRIKLDRKEEQRHQNAYESVHLTWRKFSTVELPYLDATEAKKESGYSTGGWFSLGNSQRETTGTIQKQQGEMETLYDVVYKHNRNPGYEIHQNGVWKIQVEVTFKENEDDDEDDDEDEETNEAETEEQLGGLVETKNGNISLRDFHEQYGGVHRSEEEVLEWLASEREKWGPGQLFMHGSDGRYDCKTRNPFNTYEIDGRIYNAAQFGNWLAGYNGGYWLGHLGRGLMIIGGIGFDATDTLKDRLGFDAGNPPYLPDPEFDWDRDSRDEILSGWSRGMADNPHRRALTVTPLPNNDASPTQVTRPGPPQGPAVPGSTPTPFVPEPASVQGARLQQLLEEQSSTFPDTIFSNLHDGTQQAEFPISDFDSLRLPPTDLLQQHLSMSSVQPSEMETIDMSAILQNGFPPPWPSPAVETLDLRLEDHPHLLPQIQADLERLIDRQNLESLLRHALKPTDPALTPPPEIPGGKRVIPGIDPGDRFQIHLPSVLPPFDIPNSDSLDRNH